MMKEVVGSLQPGQVWTIKGLGAEGPFPELKEKLMLFGQFVGDWEMDARYAQPDGTEIKTKGEIHFGWILNGRAVQDVWMSKDERTGKAIPSGTTVRYYDPKIDAWHNIWISPKQGVLQTFVARKESDEIVLRGKTREGYPEHWIFSEITPLSFRWRAVESRDMGKTWIVTEEMRVGRITPG
ncbi:hypothetical protein E6H36_03350 [Candidatus Bathyarchaeota archaeon]|nr:MAG: hypothetical protein E6H36_03350 [Candidatus Bathyarchaeota archaeon]TMI31790.1 MAG: hypothetical protein E6H29_03510 [Candidatus Bathyarchaeota archaeon]